jgi:predicted DNA-binding protein (MmcQ/YjbR family)
MLNEVMLRDYCLGQIAAVEEFPFGPEAAVFKVLGKMFALMPVDADPARINLKVDPFIGEVLRENHKAVTGAYHMNKRHWVTITVDGSMSDDEVTDLIDASYDLVVSGLTRKDKETLSRMNQER